MGPASSRRPTGCSVTCYTQRANLPSLNARFHGRSAERQNLWGNAMNSELPGLLSAVVTILALLLFFYMGTRVAAARGKHGIKAPATTGHPEMDRAVRVHMNTLEQLVVFLPLLWLATAYFHWIGWLPAAIGVV